MCVRFRVLPFPLAASMVDRKGKMAASGEGFAEAAEPSIEERIENLNLIRKEDEDLDLSDEIEGLIKEVRWLALFRVHTQKPFCHAALFNDMRNAWMVSKEVTFKVKAQNLFLVQFHCLGDYWNRVMEGGPWVFR